MSSSALKQSTAALKGIKTAQHVREEFIQFFTQRHQHVFWPSSPVVPLNDPTLLFNNAGMNQFKPIFLGDVDEGSPFAVLKRAVNTQKCIRAGGKHNDLEDVGKDVYHHTFFEMLGNWSFGDYFKEEAIGYAWELLTEVWKLPKDRLYATYFGGDPKVPSIPADTAALTIWKKYLPEERILPFGCKDNFWEMGDTGPCGPCSEIHFDRIGERNAASFVNQDDPDVLEIWNLVFMQFNREASGSLVPLPAPCVDTGMGLERVASILQNKTSNYDTDLFTPIFSAIREKIPGLKAYGGKVGVEDVDKVDMAYRVIADHIRTLTIAISDGAMPSNEGRGILRRSLGCADCFRYVLRRILRRAVRYGRQFLNAPKDSPWFYTLVDSVVATLGHVFPEVQKNPDSVKNVLRLEETQFSRTLDRGVTLFNQTVAKLRGAPCANKKADCSMVIPGKAVFELYATYGFPVDLTELMAEEIGMTVDTDGFNAAFQAHQKASENQNFKAQELLALQPDDLAELAQRAAATQDQLKYDWESEKGIGPKPLVTLKAIWDGHAFVDTITSQSHGSRSVGLVFDQTNFYAEAGGQVADIGEVRSAPSVAVEEPSGFIVTDTRKVAKYIVHIGHLKNDASLFSVGDSVVLDVDLQRRCQVAKHHTATHLLNFCLRQVLGESCEQRGSLVEPQRARFDYVGSRPLTEAEIGQVEASVMEIVDQGSPVFMEELPLTEAKKIVGLRAVFGEVYPDPVRVVSVGSSVRLDQETCAVGKTGLETSIEFCGGTHIQNVREIEDFVILSEESIARGVRRITVAVGKEGRETRQRGHVFLDRLHAYVLSLPLTSETEPEVVEGLGEALVTFKTEFQTQRATLPLLVQKKSQELLEEMSRRHMAEVKFRQKAMRKDAQILGVELGEKAKGCSQLYVYNTERRFDGDFKILEAFIESFKSQAPEAGLLVLSQGSTTIAVLAMVPKLQASKVSAGAWVSAVVKPLGGRGGGKPETARGTIASVEALQEAEKNARGFIEALQ